MLKLFRSITHLSIFILLIGNVQGAISLTGVKRNLFDSLMMGNFKSGIHKLCNSDQKCIISLTEIRCALELHRGQLSQKGNCTYQNKKGNIGVLYDQDSLTLAQQLIAYGADYKNNGSEVKLHVTTAICAGKKNTAGQFVKTCQLRD